jgi:hypothetical protein
MDLLKYFSHPSLSYLGYFLFFSNLTRKTKTGTAEKGVGQVHIFFWRASQP